MVRSVASTARSSSDRAAKSLPPSASLTRSIAQALCVWLTDCVQHARSTRQSRCEIAYVFANHIPWWSSASFIQRFPFVRFSFLVPYFPFWDVKFCINFLVNWLEVWNKIANYDLSQAYDSSVQNCWKGQRFCQQSTLV